MSDAHGPAHDPPLDRRPAAGAGAPGPAVTIVQPDRAPLSEAAARLEQPPRTLSVHALERLDPAAELLIVPRHTDQEALWRARDRVRAFLDAGGVVASFIEHYRPWLPGGSYRHTDHRLTRYTVQRAAAHPVFDPIPDRELYEFRGVVGWFAQGYLEPPDGAEVLLTDPAGEALAYVDRRSTPGTIIATSGADLLVIDRWRRGGFAGALERLIDWARSELGR